MSDDYLYMVYLLGFEEERLSISESRFEEELKCVAYKWGRIDYRFNNTWGLGDTMVEALNKEDSIKKIKWCLSNTASPSVEKNEEYLRNPK